MLYVDVFWVIIEGVLLLVEFRRDFKLCSEKAKNKIKFNKGLKKWKLYDYNTISIFWKS